MLSRDATPFDAQWADAMRAIVRTFREQQRKDGPGPYKFQRASRQPTETLLAGYGAPTVKNGMIHSGFRPSDDACQYQLFVPANLFAVTTLREMAKVASEARNDNALARDAAALADEVAAAVAHPRTRRTGGRAAAALFTAVFPANVAMARRWSSKPASYRAVAWGRLPLQIPLVWWALRVSGDVRRAR